MKPTCVVFSFLFVTTISTAQNESINKNFLGFNLGGSIATSALAFKHHTYKADGALVQDHNHGNSGFALALEGTYRIPIKKHVVLGSQVYGEHNFAKVRRVTIPDAPLELNTAYWNYGVAGELGFATAKNNLLYILVGPEFVSAGSYYRYLNPNSFGKTNTTLVGVMIGVGAEQLLTKHFHISEQINYGWLNTINTHLSNQTVRKDGLRLSTGMLTFSYQFV